MAMLKCYECNSDVSELADTCPNCGAPTEGVLRAEDKIRRSTSTANIVALLAFAAIFGGCVSGFTSGFGANFWVLLFIGGILSIVARVIHPN